MEDLKRGRREGKGDKREGRGGKRGGERMGAKGEEREERMKRGRGERNGEEREGTCLSQPQEEKYPQHSTKLENNMEIEYK